jgi:hypothetical protein
VEKAKEAAFDLQSEVASPKRKPSRKPLTCYRFIEAGHEGCSRNDGRYVRTGNDTARSQSIRQRRANPLAASILDAEKA